MFVIVHGGFGGGWEWTPVAQTLRESGHVVFTPTLSGMGERSHLGPGLGRNQPVATFTEPIHLTGSVARVPRAFIRCTGHELDVGGDPIEPMAARARTEGWPYRELRAPHDPHLFDPTATAATLEELAAAASTDRRPSARPLPANGTSALR